MTQAQCPQCSQPICSDCGAHLGMGYAAQTSPPSAAARVLNSAATAVLPALSAAKMALSPKWTDHMDPYVLGQIHYRGLTMLDYWRLSIVMKCAQGQIALPWFDFTSKVQTPGGQGGSVPYPGPDFNPTNIMNISLAHWDRLGEQLQAVYPGGPFGAWHQWLNAPSTEPLNFPAGEVLDEPSQGWSPVLYGALIEFVVRQLFPTQAVMQGAIRVGSRRQ